MTDQEIRDRLEQLVPKISEAEKSRLAVIRRELARGYGLTMKDQRFLLEMVDRAFEE